MSTRGIIARPTGDTWEGREHHWDSYPTGLGAALFQAYHKVFHGDIQAMRKFLIDDHPGGWSTVVEKDWTLEPGFVEHGKGDCVKCGQPHSAHYRPGIGGLPLGHHPEEKPDNRPQCYCHGDRNEDGWLFTRQDADHDKEYAYILADHALIIERWVWREKRWEHLAMIPWNTPDPQFQDVYGD